MIFVAAFKRKISFFCPPRRLKVETLGHLILICDRLHDKVVSSACSCIVCNQGNKFIKSRKELRRATRYPRLLNFLEVIANFAGHLPRGMMSLNDFSSKSTGSRKLAVTQASSATNSRQKSNLSPNHQASHRSA